VQAPKDLTLTSSPSPAIDPTALIRQQPQSSDIHCVDLATELLRCRYKLIRELGRGGMAVVYLAENLDTGQQLAIKTMSTRLTGTAKQRFTREFSTIASIQHPHCLTVYEYGETQAGPYFAMELFSAEPVTELIGKPLKVILKAIYQLADAIDFVHTRRIIHRDLKPGNMLVRQRGEEFEVRLTDFGLAKFANTSSSMSADVNFMGTIAYCAPEQIMREELDFRADIYAFGVVCYELLAGRHPFADAKRNAQLMISQQLRKNPTPLGQLASPDLPFDISHEISLMLEKALSQRPASLKPLRQLIATHLGWSVEESDDSSLDNRSRKLSTTFVARDAECRQLELLVQACLSPSQSTIDAWQTEPPPSFVFITGEAGIGKSSLMRQVARTALVEGAKIYDGRCFEGNLSPFQPIVAVVKQLLVEQLSFRSKADDKQLDAAFATTTFLQSGDSTTQIDDLLINYAPELHRIGPEFRNLLPGKAFEQAEMCQESDYIYRAVATFMVELGKLQPTCILIDDLQWADQATRTLLRHIGASLADAHAMAARSGTTVCRLFVCATSRAGTEYASVEEYIDTTSNRRRIHLQPFQADGLRQMIASVVGAQADAIEDGLAILVAQQCLGNPFYITSTLKEWLADGRLKRIGDRWQLDSSVGDDSNVSFTVREGLLKRIKTLDKIPLQVASLAAVIGKVVDVNLLTETLSSSNSRIFELVYDELRIVASQMMLKERVEHTLSATALVNETYVRLEVSQADEIWNSRAHFFSAAAETMRRILIDRARAKATAKRSANRQLLEIDSLVDGVELDLDLLLDLDSLLSRLSETDAQAAEFVKLRLFAGRSVVEAGEILNLSRWSAYQLWDFCRAWFAVYRA
jgi:RNA polymerase sigma factor (TIGR02999 family)